MRRPDTRARGRIATLAVIIAGLLWLVASFAVAADKLEIRVLYCGEPGSAREADFCSFLERHFSKVAQGDFRDFKEEQARDYDVVLFDWSGTSRGGVVETANVAQLKNRAPKLSPEYSRPTIFIGAGGYVAHLLRIKIDWLCLCLDGPAYKLNLEHKIFHRPLEVGAQLESIPTRKDYRYKTIDPDLGDAMQVWHVQTKNWPEIDSGLVSTLYGFTDSPDAEVFAQGLAAKGPDTAALARQGNFFLWGFSATPSNMTPSGQRLFVNAIAYMRAFDGQRPLVHSAASSREWALRNALWPRALAEGAAEKAFQEAEPVLRGVFKDQPELSKDFKDIDSYLAMQKASFAKIYATELETSLPADLRERFGTDSDKYLAYYRENLEFLRPAAADSHQFIVDDDAKNVGSSNRKIELLDRCVSMLERNDQPELATRLLRRYTQEEFDTAQRWRDWLETNRKRLFFSDVGGFKFFVGPTAIRRVLNAD